MKSSSFVEVAMAQWLTHTLLFTTFTFCSCSAKISLLASLANQERPGWVSYMRRSTHHGRQKHARPYSQSLWSTTEEQTRTSTRKAFLKCTTQHNKCNSSSNSRFRGQVWNKGCSAQNIIQSEEISEWLPIDPIRTKLSSVRHLLPACPWKVMAQNEAPEEKANLAQQSLDWFRLYKICSRADMALFRTITTAKAKAYKGHAPCTPSPTATPITRPHSATSINHCALWSAPDRLMLANFENSFFFFFSLLPYFSQGFPKPPYKQV